MNLFLNFFLIFPFLLVKPLLKCSRCSQNVGDINMNCGNECFSDYCYQSFYYYDTEGYTVSNTGCIIGNVTELGCRVNQDGQTLCICQGNFCNANVSLVEEDSVKTLKAQICHKSANDGINTVLRWEKPCAGTFCVFRNYSYELDNTTLTSQEIDCSKANDYDLFSTNPIFFYYPNNCVKLQYTGQPSDISCYGNSMNYSTLTFPTENLIDCYMDFYSPSLPYIRTRTFCKGQMCFISSNPHGDVQRGCISFAPGLSGQEMESQYYRSYTDMEQWLCKTNHCNFDLIGAENSWDESKAEYKNISRLQQWNVFYIINYTPVFNLNWFFLLLTITITTF